MAERFGEIRMSDLRAIRRLTGQLMEAEDLPTLGRELIQGTLKILPADFMLWNLWTLEMDQVLAMESNNAHCQRVLECHGNELAATIHHHPVIAAGHLDNAMLRPQRMSDYESDTAFLDNPLYREVYRHVDSRHQMAYDAIRLEDSRVVLSWNRRDRDFTHREMQLLHVVGLQVAALSRRLEDRRHLRRTWDDLAGALGLHAAGNESPPLGRNDGYILSAMIRGTSRAQIAGALHWRRDTLDRHLGILREKMGYENMAQLQQALADLRFPARGARQGGE
ncbi:hypothetical protein OVA24_05960 [Luteolibacter sp. SL250]|uniref:hypothetical protein n=1 Tax=Luteolibacter sp. SL250 TaxID=2995170 RepID=UPI00226EA90B|nr:hypothetical protein [Luteolibacter sp. SL250]WAC20924.1 hypothetical protein OVA24_05960 [Luteolibacter sp. SL250]